MKRILFTLILTTSFFKGFSQDWVKIMVTSKGDTVCVNQKLVKKGGTFGKDEGVVRVWTKTLFKKFEVKSAKKVYPNAVVKKLEEFDCINKKSREITSILYDNDGVVIYSGENQEYDENWNFVVPDTVGEATLTFVCELFN